MKATDKPFLIITLLLVVSGFLIFNSASLGLLTQGGEKFSQVTFNQIVFGLMGGLVACLVTWKVDYNIWRKYSLLIFGMGLILNILLFVPGLGLAHGGAKRWLDFGLFSFQPSELLKIAFIIYSAAWIASARDRIDTFWGGLVPFSLILLIPAILLLLQPDTDTLVVVFITGISMFVAGGGKWKHAGTLVLAACIGLAVVAFVRPYVMERILTFINPDRDPLGSSYQIQQSLIAIGSGGIFGRGFGKSVQKFNFLPEPIGDSIFAVMSEEFGFVGSLSLILLFVAFAIRGGTIGARAPDSFGGLLSLGIVILIVSQSFINIGAMLGVLPLTGIPLLFVSHGGTALFITLAEVGIVLNVSKRMREY